MKRRSGDGASVQSDHEQLDDLTLALRERVGAAEEPERLGRRRSSKADRDLALTVPLERCRLDHHPPSVDGAQQRVRSGRGAP